jgi:hypothetical protein
MYRQYWSKNLTFSGAINSCNVQPLVNHALFRKEEFSSFKATRFAVKLPATPEPGQDASLRYA